MSNTAEDLEFREVEVITEEEMAHQGEDLGAYIAKEYSDHRNTEGFRHDILMMVSNGKYRAVREEIRAFQVEKNERMPFFKVKTDRYFRYVDQLIEAIEEHKSIPDFDNLPVGQQKKVYEQVFQYFDELNNTLKRIEKVIHDLKVQDVRSTIWLIKVFSACACALLAAAAFAEARDYLGNPLEVVMRQINSLLY